jgi:hypothetical protein
MVTAPVQGNTSHQGWAQVGYGEFGLNAGWDQPSCCHHVWAQEVRDYNFDTKVALGLRNIWRPAPTGPDLYTVGYRSGDQRVHYIVGSNEIGKTIFNAATAWTADWQAQYFGETFHVRSDVVGTLADPVHFTGVQRKNSGEDQNSWTDVTNLTLNTDKPDRYHREKTNPTQNQSFNIWTHPLYSLS